VLDDVDDGTGRIRTGSDTSSGKWSRRNRRSYSGLAYLDSTTVAEWYCCHPALSGDWSGLGPQRSICGRPWIPNVCDISPQW